MNAPNVAAHTHMSDGGAAGGELTLLIINKVINDDTRNVASHQREFGTCWTFTPMKIRFLTISGRESCHYLVFSHCFKHADPTEPHAMQEIDPKSTVG